MFDALLRMQLGPIVERLAEMESQLEDLYRRAESFCRIGICQHVDAASHTFNWVNGPTSFSGSREQVDIKVGAASLTMNAQSITLQIGGTSLLLDAGGAHFSGPVVDHQGRVISPR